MSQSSAYKEVIVETFRAKGEWGSSKIRVRPVAGQGLDINLRVECSKKMREQCPIGSKIRIMLKLITNENGSSFLYAHHNANYKVLTDDEVNQYLSQL